MLIFGYFPLLIILLLGLGLLLFPLFGQWRLMLVVGISCFLLAVAAYIQIGGWRELENYKRSIYNQTRVNESMREFKGIDDLINKLKVKIAADPSKDQGWYLLGRLYLSQKKWHQAKLAFAKAMHLNSTVTKYQINYGLALFNEHNREYSVQVIKIFEKVLQQDSNQPDALITLGELECKNKNYKSGLMYLRRLLALLPEDTEEAQIIKELILRCKPR